MKSLLKFLPVVLLLPAVASAQTFGGIGRFVQDIMGFINDILVPLVFALAFLVFIWGLFVTFILGGRDPGKQEEGKSLLFWAIIAFVVMVSIWGIVNLLAGGLGWRDQEIGTIPNVPTTNR